MPPVQVHLENRRVPWPDLQAYLDNHSVIVKFISLVEGEFMTKQEVEAKLPKPLHTMFEFLYNTLKRNGVIVDQDEEEKKEGEQVGLIATETITLLGLLVAQNARNREEIQAVIEYVMPEMKERVGAHAAQLISQKVAQSFIEFFKSVQKSAQENSQPQDQ